MVIELLKHWQGYKPGRVFDMPDGAAELLLKRNFAKRVSREIEGKSDENKRLQPNANSATNQRTNNAGAGEKTSRSTDRRNGAR